MQTRKTFNFGLFLVNQEVTLLEMYILSKLTLYILREGGLGLILKIKPSTHYHLSWPGIEQSHLIS